MSFSKSQKIKLIESMNYLMLFKSIFWNSGYTATFNTAMIFASNNFEVAIEAPVFIPTISN